MNTITDLRRTLDQHAADVADPATVARTAAVHHRVAVVRRRRRAVGTGALALVVVAGVSTTLVTRESTGAGPAAPIVLGQRAPATIGSLGYTYRTDGHAETFSRSGSVKVSASAEPRLFSWTTEGGDAVRVTLPDGEVVHSTKTGFQDFALVPAGERGILRVSVPRGRVGLASYDLTSVAPPGYTKAGVTFRERVADAALLAATISDEGRTDITTSYVEPRGSVSLSVFCTRLPKGDVVNISFGNGGPVSQNTCGGGSTFDPGATEFTALHPRHPGRTTRVRAWLSKGFHDRVPLPQGSAPGIRIGVAVYGPVSEAPVGGTRVPRVVESRGHTWRLASTRTSSTSKPLTTPVATKDRIASLVWRTAGHTEITFGASSETPTGSSSPGGVGGLPYVWVPAGATARASIDHGSGRWGIAFYDRID